MYYHECPMCGAHLDPGERCDCTRQISRVKKEPSKVPSCDLTRFTRQELMMKILVG